MLNIYSALPTASGWLDPPQYMLACPALWEICFALPLETASLWQFFSLFVIFCMLQPLVTTAYSSTASSSPAHNCIWRSITSSSSPWLILDFPLSRLLATDWEMLLWPKMQFEVFNRWGSDQGNVCGGPHQHMNDRLSSIKGVRFRFANFNSSTLFARTLTHQLPTLFRPNVTFLEGIWDHRPSITYTPVRYLY